MFNIVLHIALLCASLLLLCGTASGADLYLLELTCQEDATALSSVDVNVVVRLENDYLVLAENESTLNSTGVKYRLLATDIDRSELAIDMSNDRRFVDQLPVVYERGNLKILHANVAAYPLSVRQDGLAAIPIGDIKIEYTVRRPFNWRAISYGVDLDSLIDLVERDSIQFYSERLEAFYRRVAGTDSNHASADWVYSKFQEFGYDSIYYDTFTADIWGEDGFCKNVIAVKLGISNPGKQVVVCAHRDAVPNSPGADDNGSGTVAVLELARVLKNIPTDITYCFVSLDAEEAGLYGAFNYANKAAIRGDTLVYALNSDMIGNFENTDKAKARYWGDSTYSVLWAHLADSLLDITSVVPEDGGSDHLAFYFMGYRNSGIQEFEFSPYYHSPQDSTVYLSYDYMTLVTKANLATAYVVNSDAMMPGVTFAYPGGRPEYITPGDAYGLQVQIGTWGEGQIVSGSEKLHYSLNSDTWVTVDLTKVSGNVYTVEFPAVLCGDMVEYYLTADELTSGSYSDPDPTKPYKLPAATSSTISFEDDFSTDKVWIVYSTANNGTWERCRPSTNLYYKSPGADYDHNDYCYITGCKSSDGDVDDGYTGLISPIFSASEYRTRIRYAHWFFNEIQGGFDPQDSMVAYISNDGGLNWTPFAMIGPDEMNDRKWYCSEWWVTDIIEPTSHMRLKFTASDMGVNNTVEGAIDAISVNAFTCDYIPPPLCGDCDNSDVVDVDDAVFLITYIFNGGPAPDPIELCDVDCSGDIDIDDVVYLIQYIFAAGPEPCADCT